MRQDATYGRSRGVRAAIGSRVSARSRRERLELFLELVEIAPGERVLDAGSGGLGLRGLAPHLDVTAVSLDPVESWTGPPEAYVRGDLRELPFDDGAFDVVYCNSVIEHIAPADRAAVAREIRRVGRRYFVQTPNKYFPVEPHALLPLFQFLPQRLQRPLWPLGVSRSPYEPIHLLTVKELRSLFPDGRLVRERLAGVTKSLVIVGPTSGRRGAP